MRFVKMKKLVIIAYDVADDKNRSDLRDLLLECGTPINKSVFECQIHKRELLTIENKITSIIDNNEDTVAIYPLCNACSIKKVIIGKREAAGNLEHGPIMVC